MQKPGVLSFKCNICGTMCNSPMTALNREEPSCDNCHSTVRMRAMVHAISIALFGNSLPLTDFPVCKDLKCKGMSDWDGYAIPLSKKLGYQNTFYHKTPRLDITNISNSDECSIDVLISTDVFEHVAPPVSVAFCNVRKMLKSGGAFVFSVPYKRDGTTCEHYPELFNYKIIRREGKPILINETRDGRLEEYTDLVFHGGEGETLEMRVFSESGLLNDLQKAGFKDIQIIKEPYFPFGIYWPYPGSFPIIAREKALGFDILEWGPKSIMAGNSINIQPNGRSAIWIKIKGVAKEICFEIHVGGKQLEGVVRNGNLVTALLPKDIISTCGTYPVDIYNKNRNKHILAGFFSVL